MPTDPGGLTPVGVGDVLAGKYEVERVLGSGGMGVVVAAKHLHLGERVAIKFLLQQAAKKAEVKQRFLREARAAVRIKSEHVARVFDVGTLEDGAPYMVMELLEGSDLSTLLKTKGAVAIDTAVEYVLQACEAIAEAHSIGIIHRDLKPANLFVARRADGSPVVKVIDFGISKVAEPEGDVEMTKTDVMMGSPVYMAPEQMISARDVDVRADVWSLGVILHYLIMGAQPFRGNSVTQLYASILEGPPNLRETRPDVPPGLEAAIVKCLHASPKDRWANVAEFALAIAEFGPPQARVSAERVARTLGVTPAHRSTPPPPVAGAITPLAVASTELALGESTGSRTGGSKGAGNDATSGSQQTDGSWGGTKGPLQRSNRSRNILAAVAIVAVAGVAGAGAVILVSGSAETAVTPDAAHVATTVTVTAPATGGATVSPAPIETPATKGTEAPPAVVPSTPSAAATTPPPASASAGVPAKSARPSGAATARPTATATKPKTDLFSDPH